MEGKRVRIKDIEYQCIGKCGSDWTFTPLNEDNDEVVIISDNDLAELVRNNLFEELR